MQDHSQAGRVGLTVRLEVERASAADLSAAAHIRLNGQTVVSGQVEVAGDTADIHLEITDPQLWWPNGLGAQPLYEVMIELLTDQTRLIDTVSKRIGLRELRLDRHDDQWGESFQFVCNGVPFFAKGANWIPADTFATRVTRADYARLLNDAAVANMNMLRVWGGGIYEEDVFYDLCDELGLCIWQDFMFSCATYPAFDAAFMANVKAEAEDNVRRIRHHPCMALWCGNNELEQGLVGDSWTEHTMSWEDYSKLFDVLLPEVVNRLDPQRDYWPCSPHSPRGNRNDWINPNWGDAHLWAVWHGKEPFEWYRTCEHRFNSEFGFQSFPEPKTAYLYTLPEDRNITSPIMEHHQRSGTGNATIMHYMLDWFRLPTSFENVLWASQILQGMAMKYAVEHWRRNMPRGMGTLYWQLNDCWPVASWSSIDSIGRWKALHYMARRFYAPLLVSGLEDAAKGTVEIHVTSDRLEVVNGTITWRLTNTLGAPLASGDLDTSIAPNGSQRVTTLDLRPQLEQHGARTLLLWLTLKVGGITVSTNLVTFARPKQLDLRRPDIAVTVHPGADGAYQVTLSSPSPALWVWLELRETDARYSDNFIYLEPGVPATIEVQPAAPLSVDAFRAALLVRSLVDTY
jgi:beta-mannosidase